VAAPRRDAIQKAIADALEARGAVLEERWTTARGDEWERWRLGAVPLVVQALHDGGAEVFGPLTTRTELPALFRELDRLAGRAGVWGAA
jgi:hypothetical protein